MAKNTGDGNEFYRLAKEAYGRGDYRAVIELLEQALDDSELRNRGEALNDLGIAHSRLEEYDKAIGYYNKAIKISEILGSGPGLRVKGMAWNNMGVAYYRLGQYKEAVSCYQAALQTLGTGTPDHVRNNMVWAYWEQGRYDLAKESAPRVLDTTSHDEPAPAGKTTTSHYQHPEKELKLLAEDVIPLSGIAQLYMGVAYDKQGDEIKAKEAWKQAVNSFKHTDPDFATLLAYRLTVSSKETRNTGELLALSLTQNILQKLPSEPGGVRTPAERRILQLAVEVATIVLNQHKMSLDYCRPSASSSATPPPVRRSPWRRGRRPLPGVTPDFPSDYFLNLKAWSSNLPLMADYLNEHFDDRPVQGGGYYIRWRGTGIVVDPGINFIENLHGYGLHLTDINLVFVTHCHIDHNSDLTRLVDLLREYNSSVNNDERHEIIFYLDDDTYHQLATSLEVEGTDDGHLSLLKTKGYYGQMKIKHGLLPRPFRTKHVDELKHSLGMVLEFFDKKDDQDIPENSEPLFRLGLTSDTQLTKTVTDCVRNCDAVVAHFSKTNEDDLLSEDTAPKMPHHLGYVGVRELFKHTKAKLCIAAEWSGDKGDMRYQLAELWRMEIGNPDKTIIPADIGLLFSIPEMKIRCRTCQRLAPPECVMIGRPDTPYGRIMYYCEDCLSTGAGTVAKMRDREQQQ